MKKRMLEENLMKISELADRMVTDPAIASILLCYLLYIHLRRAEPHAWKQSLILLVFLPADGELHLGY